MTQRYLADSVAPGPVYAVEFSPDGTRVVTGSGDGSARVFDAASGAEICRPDHDCWVRAVAFSPDGTRLATSSSDGSARVGHRRRPVDRTAMGRLSRNLTQQEWRRFFRNELYRKIRADLP